MRALISFPLVALTLALVACSSSPDGPTKKQRAQLHKENALQFYYMNELDRAQDQIRRAIEIEDDDESLQLILGMILQKRDGPQDVNQAEKIFRKLKKDDFRVTIGLGEALERKGRYYDDAARALLSGKRFAEGGDPKTKGKEFQELARENWEEAVKWYEASLELKENQLDALNGLQRATALLGRNEESIEWANRLLTEVDHNVAFYKKQLDIPQITVSDERRWRDKLHANERTEVVTRLHVSTLLRILGRLEDAREHLDRVIELEPDDPVPYARRAQILKDLGEYEQAVSSVDRFLALSSDLDFEHPEIRRAYNLRTECELALQESTGEQARN